MRDVHGVQFLLTVWVTIQSLPAGSSGLGPIRFLIVGEASRGTTNPRKMANPANAAGMLRQCQVCGNMRRSAVKFHHNIRMIVLRQTRSFQANRCKTCVGSRYGEFMGKNLLFGAVGNRLGDCYPDFYGDQHGDLTCRDRASWVAR